jgi:ubiquinone biosynthesis protein UbiJ
MIGAALLATLNHLLEGAEWARVRLSSYAGRHACFDMPPFLFGFVITPTGLCEPQPSDSTPDVTIHLPADTPLRLMQGLDRVMAGARVDGNAEFATELSFVLRHLRWDAEEDLSRIVGDIAARRLVLGAERFASMHSEGTRRLAENISEYLVHEQGVLIGNAEFSSFRDDLLRLNDALSRLEARSRIIR